MTAPQPDTETLVQNVRRTLDMARKSRRTQAWLIRDVQVNQAQAALDALAARLAEAEAQRDEALLVREGFVSPVQKVIELQRRVATLEAALAKVGSWGVQPGWTAWQNIERVREFARAALGSLPSQPAQPDYVADEEVGWEYTRLDPAQPASLTAEDAAYVARRATWERE